MNTVWLIKVPYLELCISNFIKVVITFERAPKNQIRLEFNSPINTIKVMLIRSVYKTTIFLGRLKQLTSTWAHSFARN